MRTSKKILGINERSHKAERREVSSAVAGLALATLVIAAGVAKPTHADTSPPVNECSDFACEK
jgi:hypothetical protein